MSNTLTRELWSHPMKAPEKLVLIYLADRADGKHQAWPSLPTIAKATGLGRSTVARVVAVLEEAGYLSRSTRFNSSNLYTVKTGNKASKEIGPRPGAGLPPSRSGTLSPNEAPSTSSPTRKRGFDFAGWPQEPSPELLKEWMEVRKAKRAPLTQSIVDRFGAEMHKAVAEGWTIPSVLGEIIYNGWRGFKADWLIPQNEKPQPVRTGANGKPQGRPDYAQGRRSGNTGGKGGAIDRVLANARARAETGAPGYRDGSDWSDDDGGVRS